MEGGGNRNRAKALVITVGMWMCSRVGSLVDVVDNIIDSKEGIIKVVRTFGIKEVGWTSVRNCSQKKNQTNASPQQQHQRQEIKTREGVLVVASKRVGSFR